MAWSDAARAAALQARRLHAQRTLAHVERQRPQLAKSLRGYRDTMHRYDDRMAGHLYGRTLRESAHANTAYRNYWRRKLRTLK